MNAFFRDLRLLPIVLLATVCLLALKTADLFLDDNFPFAGDNAAPSDTAPSIIRATPGMVQAESNLSWAQQMFNFPDGKTPAPAAGAKMPSAVDKANADIITGSLATEPEGKGEKSDLKGEASAKNDTAKDKPPSGTVIKFEGVSPPSNAERAILERLQQRRQELDARGRELDIRESLIKAAEKRMEGQLAELKEVEGRITVETKQKNDAEAARLKGLITMYETMKPRDAAKIFDRLDPGVLLEVAGQINPRQMAEILAQMTPDSAQRLTVELASKAQHTAPGTPAELPKIEGRPRPTTP
jgi:flagellar motility protein MotE (MotC chaperone)